MQKFILPLACSLSCSAPLYGVTLFFEDFEDSTVGYTTSVADDLSDIAASDYFGRIAPDTATPPTTVSYSNSQGFGYYGAQDTDGTPSGNIDTITLDVSGISIAGFTNLSFSGFFAEDDSEDGGEDWDTTSSVLVQYQVDGGGFTNLLAFESELGLDGNATNEAPRVDTNFDGTGDGAELTNDFTQFSAAIPDGTTLDFRITISTLDAGDEDIAFDNLQIEGDAVIPEPSTALLGSLAMLILLGRRR